MTIIVREYDEDHRTRAAGGRGDRDHKASGRVALSIGPLCRAEYIIDTAPAADAAARPALLRQRKSSFFGANEGSFVRICRHYLVEAPRRVFVDLFLPLGYPNSVGDSYLSYQIYDSIQGICSYLRGVVSTSAVLTAAGVGDAEATAMSAAATWSLRDGLGMIGGLTFSYVASKDFDSRVKEWRLFADVINDVGLTLDMVAPFFGKGGVLYVTSLATVCKSMCGISAGATKASITHHFAVRGNMADLSAKEGTQETLVSLLGMMLGVALARYLHQLETSSCGEVHDSGSGGSCNPGRTAMVVSWSIFIALTLLHVWANYRGVKLLRLRSLNRQRAEVALRGVVEGCAEQCQRSYVEDASGDSKNGGAKPRSLDIPRLLSSIPAPAEVDESLWASTRKLLFSGRVRLGTRLSETFKFTRNEDVRHCLEEEFRNERYILYTACGKNKSLSSSWRVCVTLRVGANEHVELKAFLHAMIVARCISNKTFPSRDKGNDVASWQRDMIRITHVCVNELFGEVGDAASSIIDQTSSRPCRFSLDALSDRGWDCERLYLGFGPWRIQWEEAKEE